MQEYKRGFQRIHALAERISTTQVDELIKAHLAQHLCVIVSGIIENACSHTLSTYAETTASPATAGYAKKKLAQFNNADPKKIEELVGTFSKDWKEKLCSFWSGEIRDSIGSIVSNRHNISHGRQVAVSLAQILKWTENAEKFCEMLENIIIPNR